MPYSGSPATSATDRVRLAVGDAFEDFEILDDGTYQYFLDKYDGNEQKAAMDAARAILFQIARYPTRERTGDIEVWSDWAANYKAALDDFISDVGASVYVGLPYAGGISQQDMMINNLNPDRVPLGLPKITGCPFRHHIWDNDFYYSGGFQGDM